MTDNYSLFAVVTDATGRTNGSPEVEVAVISDTQRPAISITSAPANFARLRTPAVTLVGKAFDANLARVEYSVNDGFFQPASGLSSWIAEVPLVPGTNVIVVRAIDVAGLFSDVRRTYTYVVLSPLSLQVEGRGTVVPNLDGRQLEIGRFYRVVAVPAAGQVFAGWEGVPAERAMKPILIFEMQPNLVLKATFIPNPFVPAAGTFNGLVYDPANVTPESSGFLRITVNRSGTFSGSLVIDRRSYPFFGRLDARGMSDIPVLRRPLRPVVIHFEARLPEAVRVYGTVTDGSWIASFNMRRKSTLQRTRQLLFNRYLAFMRIGSETNSDEVELAGVLPNGALIFRLAADRNRFSIPAFPANDAFAGETPVYFPKRRGQLPVLGYAHLGFPIFQGALERRTISPDPSSLVGAP